MSPLLVVDDLARARAVAVARRAADLPSTRETVDHVLTNVAVLVFDRIAPFELGVLSEAFGHDRTADGVPLLDFDICGPVSKVPTTVGFDLTLSHGLDRLAAADLICVPAMSSDCLPPSDVLDSLRTAHDRGAQFLSVCSGAFVLGAAGLLDGRECTTHWKATAELAVRFPRARVVPDVLYVESGPVVSSAGTAAGLDACLHIWRREHGSAVANAVARQMVVPTMRAGDQAQVIAHPSTGNGQDALGPLVDWILEHLEDELTIEALAQRAFMSPRTLARRFRAEVGMTPHAWITRQRILRAERLLQETNRSVAWIAQMAGFKNAPTMRHHFTRARGVTPGQFRRGIAS